VDNTRYARVSHSRQWSNYNLFTFYFLYHKYNKFRYTWRITVWLLFHEHRIIELRRAIGYISATVAFLVSIYDSLSPFINPSFYFTVHTVHIHSCSVPDVISSCSFSQRYRPLWILQQCYRHYWPIVGKLTGLLDAGRSLKFICEISRNAQYLDHMLTAHLRQHILDNCRRNRNHTCTIISVALQCSQEVISRSSDHITIYKRLSRKSSHWWHWTLKIFNINSHTAGQQRHLSLTIIFQCILKSIRKWRKLSHNYVI